MYCCLFLKIKKNDKELAKNYSIPAEDINAQKINDINLTFDVVRINKNGDVIIAGKTLPDTNYICSMETIN